MSAHTVFPDRRRVTVRPGRPQAGEHGYVYRVLNDGSLRPVVVVLDGVEGSRYYAADELEWPGGEDR